MNWATYKTLTKEQREEYNFRFGKFPQPSHFKIIVLTIIMLLCIIVVAFVSYLIMTSNNEDLIKLQSNVNSLFSTGMTITNAVTGLIVIYVIYDVGNFCSYLVREYWWKKKNKIKYRYDSWIMNIWNWIRFIFV